MNNSYFWITIIPLGIGTFLIRASMIYLSNKFTISDRLKEIFTFIPAAILPALVAPMVFFHPGESTFLMYKERVFALIIALVFAFKYRSILVTILCGLASLYLLKLI